MLGVAVVVAAGCAPHPSRHLPLPPESGDPVSLPVALKRASTEPDVAPKNPEGGEIDLVAMYPYPLDDIPRIINPTGRVHCPEVELVTYRGDIIRYHKPVTVYVGFRDRLRLFEEIVRDTAIEVYGRPPIRIRHLGSYYCRRIRAWPNYISEHGLGNAIDIEGFDFEGVSAKQTSDTPLLDPDSGQPLSPRVERQLRRPFQVRLEKHWDATQGIGAVHSRFLRLLAERVIARYDLFRVMLGPAEDGHDNHFHFDVAPWRSVTIFEEDLDVEGDQDADSETLESP